MTWRDWLSPLLLVFIALPIVEAIFDPGSVTETLLLMCAVGLALGFVEAQLIRWWQRRRDLS